MFIGRFGVNADVRSLWFSAGKGVPRSEVELDAALSRAGLKVSGVERRERDKILIAEQGKKRKRYVEKANRVTTNTHLAGTEDGRLMESFMGKARRGKFQKKHGGN